MTRWNSNTLISDAYTPECISSSCFHAFMRSFSVPVLLCCVLFLCSFCFYLDWCSDTPGWSSRRLKHWHGVHCWILFGYIPIAALSSHPHIHEHTIHSIHVSEKIVQYSILLFIGDYRSSNVIISTIYLKHEPRCTILGQHAQTWGKVQLPLEVMWCLTSKKSSGRLMHVKPRYAYSHILHFFSKF